MLKSDEVLVFAESVRDNLDQNAVDPPFARFGKDLKVVDEIRHFLLEHRDPRLDILKRTLLEKFNNLIYSCYICLDEMLETAQVGLSESGKITASMSASLRRLFSESDSTESSVSIDWKALVISGLQNSARILRDLEGMAEPKMDGPVTAVSHNPIDEEHSDTSSSTEEDTSSWDDDEVYSGLLSSDGKESGRNKSNMSISLMKALGMEVTAQDEKNSETAWRPPDRPGLDNSRPGMYAYSDMM